MMTAYKGKYRETPTLTYSIPQIETACNIVEPGVNDEAAEMHLEEKCD